MPAADLRPTQPPSPRALTHRRWSWHLLPLLLAGAGVPVQAGLLDDIGKAVKDATQKLPAQQPAANEPAQNAAAAAAANAAANSAPLLSSTRNEAGMRGLFEKKTVTGVDLLAELKAVRKVAGDRRNPGGMNTLLNGTAMDNPGGAHAGILGGLFQGGASGVAVKGALAVFENELAKAAMRSIGGDLGRHLDFLLGDTQTLQAETVTLPSPKTLTPPQMQRAVNLGAIIILTRMSARVLDQAQKDLGGLEQEYATLITRRENAATLLQTALASGLPDSASKVFSPSDLSYLQSFNAGNFVQDMEAQRLALRLLAATDPNSAKEYKLQAESLTKRQSALVRTMSGVVAFGGLLAWSGRELSKLGKDQPVAELLAFGPLAIDFFKEVPPILQSVVKIGVDGSSVLLNSANNFRVIVDGKAEDVRSASAVFDAIEKHGAMPELRNALFRNDARGLLYAVNQCDPATTAQMLDTATTSEQRATFARETRQAAGADFSFTDAFGSGEKAQTELAHTLLKSDFRPRLDRDVAMATVQIGVAGLEQPPSDAPKPGFLKWDNAQLLRMLFVNRDGSAAQHTEFEVGKVKVRPVPTMSSIYAYETLADACRQQFTPTPAPGPGGKPAKPGTPPAKPTKKT